MIPININIVVEDRLSEAVVKAVLSQSEKKFNVVKRFPDLKRIHSSSGFGYIKIKISGFNKAARGIPFLVLTDLDDYECPPVLINEWLKEPKHPKLIFRVAKREVESWVLADRISLASFLGIPEGKIPFDTDKIPDPKRYLINIAKGSRNRDIRDAIVPRRGSTSSIGPDYNDKLSWFAANQWNLKRAVKHSDSLKRAAKAINNFKPVFG